MLLGSVGTLFHNKKKQLLEDDNVPQNPNPTYAPPQLTIKPTKPSHTIEQKKSPQEKKQSFARMRCEGQINQTVIQLLMAKDQQTFATLKITLKSQTDSLTALGGNLSDKIQNLLKEKEEEIQNENRTAFSFINS